MENKVFCQSCGMPMTENEHFGTENGGGKSADYCVYCYKNGDFTQDVSMDEMIKISLHHMKEMFKDNPDFDKQAALDNMRLFFPELKRWRGK